MLNKVRLKNVNFTKKNKCLEKVLRNGFLGFQSSLANAELRGPPLGFCWVQDLPWKTKVKVKTCENKT